MKTVTRFGLLLSLLFTCHAIALEPVEIAEPVQYPHTINVPHALARGTVNFLTAWLELPRRTVLAVNESPAFGLITGPMEGVFFCSCRLVLSAADYAMLGFTGPSAYEPIGFPEYVWNAQWNPYREELPPPVEAKKAKPQDLDPQFITPPDQLF